MVSEVIVDGAELVESLGVVVLQLGQSFEVADGLPHLSHLNEALCSHLTRGHIPNAGLGNGQMQTFGGDFTNTVNTLQ